MNRIEKLAALRRALATHDLAAYVVPRADEHLSEYVPPSAERLAWLTGFTGSAGLALVLPARAAVFTDGRYTLQLARQTDPALFEPHHLVDEPPHDWLATALPPGARVGYDPMLLSADAVDRYADTGLTPVAIRPNLVDQVWPDRPAPPCARIVPHPDHLSGNPAPAKRDAIARTLRDARHHAAVLTDPASVAWLLNVRGGDVDFTPFPLATLILRDDATATLFADPAKLDATTRAWLGGAVDCAPPDALPAALAALRGRRVRVDRAGSPAWFAQALRAAGAVPVDGPDPCALPRARKNPVEQAGARAAHRRDAVALCRFLHWLDSAAGHTAEIAAADRLRAFRAEHPEFRGESFPAISGAAEHGAVIHYRVGPDTDRPIGQNEVYLIDSGAQYPDGTTDVTRTVWTGPAPAPAELKERATRVLLGHIALATAVFPEGTAGPHLDAFARRPLWDAGLDYDHGTGHGVGSYLSVHEGPASISRAGKMVPLAEGMILSDEPGFYEEGHYGIRLENLLLVQRAATPTARKPFLRFETLTLAPFDRRLLDPALMAPNARAWLDTYHAHVRAELTPLLDPPVRHWLERACEPL